MSAVVLLLALLACAHAAHVSLIPTDEAATRVTFASPSPASALPSRFLAWQGFDHQWERNVLGFLTPHRLGSFANWVESSADKATAHFEFTPGVDGDYGRTSLFAAELNGAVAGADVVRFEFSDSASHTSVPVASTKLSLNATFDLSQLPLAGAVPVDAVMNGLEIQMHCDPAKQTPPDVCNSNASWPIRVSFDLHDCATDASQSSLVCALDFEFTRGWTPTDGGGKPFNYRLDFSVGVHVVVFAGRGTVTSTPQEVISVAGSIWEGPQTVYARAQAGRAHLASTSTALVGVQSLGFELLETDGFKNRGRYIERIAYGVSAVSPFDASTGSLAYSATLGLSAARTVLPSKTNFWLRTALVVFGADVDVSPHVPIAGEVCRSASDGFSCAKKGLPEQTTDAVSVPLSP